LEILKTEGFDNIYEVDCFRGEFLGAVGEPTKVFGRKLRYQDWLLAKLATLDELGTKALALPYFEVLKDVDPQLCSIRYPKSRKNPRVLYIYVDSRKVVLLTAFEENKKSDYTNGIARAQQRHKQLIKEGKL
jgi:hypothetical protein